MLLKRERLTLCVTYKRPVHLPLRVTQEGLESLPAIMCYLYKRLAHLPLCVTYKRPVHLPSGVTQEGLAHLSLCVTQEGLACLPLCITYLKDWYICHYVFHKD